MTHTLHFLPTTTRTTACTLMALLGERLLEVALDADPRVDVDSDLDLMAQIAQQVTEICRDLTAQGRQYQTGSWTYRRFRFFDWLASFTVWTERHSKAVRDLDALDRLLAVCEHLPKAVGYELESAESYTRWNLPHAVRTCREVVLKWVWGKAADCLEYGDLR